MGGFSMLGVAAFLFIVLALLCVTAFFAFLYVRNEFRTAMKAYQRRTSAKMRGLEQTIKNLSSHISQIETVQGKTSPTGFSVSNPFQRMEDRHVEANKEFVVLNNKQVKTGTTN